MSSMGSSPGDLPVTQWIHTQPIREHRQLRSFQERFSALCAGAHVEPVGDQPMAMKGSITFFDDTAINIAVTTPTRCDHSNLKLPDDAITVFGMPRGRFQLNARGHSWDMGDGDVVFARPSQTQSLVAYTTAHLCFLSLSRPILASMAVDVDAALMRPLRAHAASALLNQYAHLLRDHGVPEAPELRRAVTLHLHDLAALMAGATGDAAHLAQQRGARAARLLAVKADIAAHAAEASLTVHAVARRQGITPRYLQMLLEEAGLTFTSLVLAHRLARARRQLGDPRQRALTVSQIAFDAGFGDLSYFNRCFRRRYGMTPTDARALGEQPDPDGEAAPGTPSR